eukprot:765720-Hanusia_phi.AAC.1
MRVDVHCEPSLLAHSEAPRPGVRVSLGASESGACGSRPASDEPRLGRRLENEDNTSRTAIRHPNSENAALGERASGSDWTARAGPTVRSRPLPSLQPPFARCFKVRISACAVDWEPGMGWDGRGGEASTVQKRRARGVGGRGEERRGEELRGVI